MDLNASLIIAGAIGTGLTGIIALVRIAINAERHRADDWRTTAQTSAAASAVHGGQVEKLVGSVEQLSATQAKMMTLLETLVSDRRTAT